MGNRPSCTEEAEHIPTVPKADSKDGGEEEESYGVKQYDDETPATQRIPLIQLPDDNRDDDSNNTQSESTASNQSFNQSFGGSSTTRTKYGETNSVVSSDYGSDASWTSKSNTATATDTDNSLLYDTDEQTALTEFADYGDNEGTKDNRQKSKMIRRSQWLKMINADDQVVVRENHDENEVETVLESDDNVSLNSYMNSVGMKTKTDGDDETTILIIDSDEEQSRCNVNEALSNHETNEFGVPHDQNATPHSNDKNMNKQNIIEEVKTNKLPVDDGGEYKTKKMEKEIDEVKEEVGLVGDTVETNTHRPQKTEKNEVKEEVLSVDGLVGDTVEANTHRPQKTDIILKESFSFMQYIPWKKSDPSGIIVRGQDVPEKNKRKVIPKLLDDVELNPKRLELQRQLLLSKSTPAMNTERRYVQPSLPVAKTSEANVGIIEVQQTNPSKIDDSEKSRPIAIAANMPANNQNMKPHSEHVSELQTLHEDATRDTPTSTPIKEATAEPSQMTMRNPSQKLKDDTQLLIAPARLSAVSFDLPPMDVIVTKPSRDAVIPTVSFDLPPMDVIVSKPSRDAAKVDLQHKQEECNINSVTIVPRKESKRLSAQDNDGAIEIGKSSSWHLRNDTKPVPESSKRIMWPGIHKTSSKSNQSIRIAGVDPKSEIKEVIVSDEEHISGLDPKIDIKEVIVSAEDRDTIFTIQGVDVDAMPDEKLDEKDIISRPSGHRRPESRQVVKIHPEQCYIETSTAITDEPINRIKPVSPKPENQEDRIRKSVSRQSTNLSNVIEIVDDDDDIDFAIVQQYDDAFNELVNQYPYFMTQNPSLMEIIRVAKLQKILSATLEMERELEDYVKSLRDQKNEVSAHYQKKLVEASRKNAEMEFYLQQQLDAVNSDVATMEHKNHWDILSVYNEFCTQCQQRQNIRRCRKVHVDDPLSLLPDTLSADKKLLLDALMGPCDIDAADMLTIQSENAALNQEVKQLEEALNRFLESPGDPPQIENTN